MDESQEKIERGHQAKALLDSTIFKDAVTRLEQRYTEAWKAANTVELREDAHRYIRLIEWFVQDIRSVAITGAATQKRLDQLQGKPITLSEYDQKWRTR